ncbi:C4-dicarboxylate ABC transporter substrate-binding protein [Actinobacillus succinogenes]|uniref:TRAP transporter solute receptor, TAXI family n=1 Tax=Actinobacillus succinogenes (strain ATCC 55618 / DSM 22257 / CCUG 43843 / 130Z) TaxID=339671 RepID=A6VQQ7_ACTSZ|nr:TAXI family TRAP transporter solute-binding subunit [Actinobacillus succinogenes]ABR75304.1 TRAP transporter solute receptor, TAXI family [Actinobacillus succinogenes 130Z]PHI40306.1 C4-dicarboxylate ABC transporter substrate-binding protein [Actinobacillus succinogenes]
MVKLHQTLKIAIAALCFSNMAQATMETSVISQPPGNGWYTYATTFNRLVPEYSNNEYKVKVIPRGGGMTNPVVVNDNKATFGFATSNAIVWAKEGMTEIYKNKANKDLRLVFDNMQEAYTIIVARKSWVESTGNDTLEKLINADKVVIATKPTGSQVPIIADFIFKALGTDFETMKKQGKVIQISSGQASQMLRDNTIDAYIDNVPAMHPNLTEITLTNDMVYIPYDETVLEKLAKVGLPTGTMPAGTYKGQDKDYINPVSATVFVSNAKVPEETVYDITKALVESQQKLKEAHPPLKFWKPEEIAKNPNLFELHPGAAKYFREQGWIK